MFMHIKAKYSVLERLSPNYTFLCPNLNVESDNITSLCLEFIEELCEKQTVLLIDRLQHILICMIYTFDEVKVLGQVWEPYLPGQYFIFDPTWPLR